MRRWPRHGGRHLRKLLCGLRSVARRCWWLRRQRNQRSTGKGEMPAGLPVAVLLRPRSKIRGLWRCKWRDRSGARHWWPRRRNRLAELTRHSESQQPHNNRGRGKMGCAKQLRPERCWRRQWRLYPNYDSKPERKWPRICQRRRWLIWWRRWRLGWSLRHELP